ncbi:MAG: glucuronate isomerase [Clostridiales bacterium]|nr:glucuronate isomerase [Clostridiales bacterium]
MADFINDDFLLQSPKARFLYHNYASSLPIVDYHCHLDPKQIAENTGFDNITELWLGGDHYKWRLMRASGIEERYITGDATDKEKFMAWAKVIGRAWGNPLYHWTSLELARYFDIYEPLSEYNAEEVWNKTSKILSEQDMTSGYFLKKSNVELVCTTDDPCDDLKWHKQIAQNGDIDTVVLPTFRPDPAIEIALPGFLSYIGRLSSVYGSSIKSFSDVKKALRSRMDLFASVGCLLADHGLEFVPYATRSDEEVDIIFKKRLKGQSLTASEIDAYKTSLLIFCATEYSKMGWTMQMHFGCRRDNNEKMFKSMGVNIGCDTIAGSNDIVTPLVSFMSLLTENDSLPKMILYSLDPTYNAQIDTLIGCFQEGPAVMKIQHGSAWWFNDNIEGMKAQLTHLALQSYLPGFIGMLTDSRSFLSYPRHEYFRRILCDLLADSVNKGMFPDDDRILEMMIKNICHDNAASYFNLK